MFSNYTALSKQAKYLIYQSILPAIAFGMFYTDISYFLTTVQGFSIEFMGLVVTVMGVSTFTTCIPLGIAADKYGRKKMLMIGTLIAGAAMAIFALTTEPAILLAAAIFEGVSEGALSASSGALMAEKCEESQRNSAFSLFSFAQSISYGIGSFAISAVGLFEIVKISNKTGHSLLFVLLGLLSVISIFMLFKVNESKRPLKNKNNEPNTKFVRKGSRSILAKYVLTSAIIAFGAGMVVPLMTAWFKLQYGISDALSGPILGVTSIIIGVVTLASPYLAKKLGLVKAIVVTQAASTIFMIATPLSSSYLVASSIYMMRAFLMNMASPLSQSMIMGLVDENERGAASGVNAALWRLPNALSTIIGAYLMGMGMLALPFFTAGILYSISIALFWYFFRKTKMPEEKA